MDNRYLVEAWIETINTQLKRYTQKTVLYHYGTGLNYKSIVFKDDCVKCDGEVLMSDNIWKRMNADEVNNYFNKFEIRMCIPIEPPELEKFSDRILRFASNGFNIVITSDCPPHLQEQYKRTMEVLKLGSQIRFTNNEKFCSLRENDNRIEIFEYGGIK